MSFWELLIVAVSLSMDAFAVSVCKGLSVSKVRLRHAGITGLYFGGFQALMPLIGYFLGAQFQHAIASVDHWIAFGLLALIGANMIRESFGEEEESCSSFGPRAMLPLAVATSIDALAVGITFAFLKVNVWIAILLNGVTTFLLSGMGVLLGHLFGEKYQKWAERLGGIVLIGLGLKILLEHTGVLKWFADLF